MRTNYQNKIANLLKNSELDFASSFLNFMTLSLPPLAIIIIYNFGNQFLEYKPILSLLLNYRDLLTLIGFATILSVWYFKIKKSKNRWPEVLSLLIVGSVFIFLNFNSNFMERLWNTFWPSVIIYSKVLYVPPVDPFHQIALYGISLFRKTCQKRIAVLITWFAKNFESCYNFRIPP